MTHHWICILTEGDVILEFSVLELAVEDSGTLFLFELGVPKVCFLKKQHPSFIKYSHSIQTSVKTSGSG